MKITDRQKAVLKKIHDFIMLNSYPPTARDVAEMMGFSSPKAATDHFTSLEKKGYIRKNSLARSIKLTDKAFAILKQDYSYFPSPAAAGHNDISYLPIISNIAAGNPALAYENIDEYIPVPESFTGAYGADFALRVKGSSMTGDHILDGDMIMVRARSTAENGEIIVALINDEAVVKRFYKTEDGIELVSSNPDYPPIKISVKDAGDSVKIVGRVVAVHRNI